MCHYYQHSLQMYLPVKLRNIGCLDLREHGNNSTEPSLNFAPSQFELYALCQLQLSFQGLTAP